MLSGDVCVFKTFIFNLGLKQTSNRSEIIAAAFRKDVNIRHTLEPTQAS